MMEKGRAFLLKVGDGGSPPTFATVAGMRVTQDTREPRRMTLAGEGIFTGSAAETRLKGSALGGLIDDYELSFEDGERLRGRLLITRLDYAGDYNGERTYRLSLESVGAVETVGQAIAA